MKFWTNVKQYGDHIYYLGYDNGHRVKEKFKFQPTLFVPAQTEDSAWHSYTGTPVAQMEFESIKEAKNFIKQYKDVENFQVYGTDKFACEYIARNFPDRDIQYKMSDIRTFFLDIEVYSGNGFPDPYEATEEVTAVTIYDSKTDRFHVWHCKGYDPTKTYDNDPIVQLRDRIVAHPCENEVSLLWDLVRFWENNYPDIVTGWYSRNFDVPYIVNRLRRLLGEKVCNRLSPWGIIQEKKSNIQRFGIIRDDVQYEFVGIAELDSLDLYKKYGPGNEESFKLGHIGQKTVGINKIEYDGSLHDLYEQDFQKYVDYNIQDVNIVVQIERVKKFIELIVEVSYAAKVPNYNDSLGTVKYWEIFIYNHLLRKNQVSEIKDISVDKDRQYAGAYVKDPIVGLHEGVVSFDFTSLYPSLIRQVNIGPETLVDKTKIPQELQELVAKVTPERLLEGSLDLSLLKKYDYSLSANGQLYRRDIVSFPAEVVGHLFTRRKEYKKQMIAAEREYEKTKDPLTLQLAEKLNISQHAYKIILNSLYGAFGNGFFQYFSIENAEAVTLTGQVMIKNVLNKTNSYLNKVLKTTNVDRVIAADTDSQYLALGDIVNAVFKGKNPTTNEKIDFLDKFASEKLAGVIKADCETMYQYLNNKENFMDMKRESIAEKAVWTGKKRYFMSVCDHEGVRYETPELSITGMMALSTPKICRDAIQDCMKLILFKDEAALHKYIADFKKKFLLVSPEQIAKPTGISDIDKYTDEQGNPRKGTPAHIRAAVNYNILLKQHNMTKRQELIINDSKIKWLYLKKPNTIQDDVIAFFDKLPKEFGLHKYVDYELIFEKSFLKPLRDITVTFGWTLEEVNNLESLFG